MDTQERIDDARATLAELEAALREALALLRDLEKRWKEGDRARAAAGEAALRGSLSEIGKAAGEFAQKPLLD